VATILDTYMTLIKKKITEIESIVNKADNRKTAGKIYLPKEWIGKKVKTVLLSLLIMMTFVVLMTSPTAAIAKKQQPTQAVDTPSSKLQNQQNYVFIAELTGDNVAPVAAKTNATGVTKFIFDPSDNNQVYYELNITNMRNDILNVDIYQGKKRENGPSLATLYRSSLGIPLSEICCKPAESEKSKFFYFNGTISKEDFEFGPLADSRDLTRLINLFNTGNAYVEVYTNRPNSLSLSDAEIRGEILPSSS
jgi:hypothetical protein